MIFEYGLFHLARCGKKDRQRLRSLVELVVSFAEKARREGLLALEEEMESVQDLFMEQGLRLMLNGIDTEVLEDILVTSVYASQLQGKELLSRMMITTGICAIHSGDNPVLVRQKMEAYLGEMK